MRKARGPNSDGRRRRRRRLRCKTWNCGAHFLQMRRGPNSCIHVFHGEGEVGQQGIRRRQLGDRCEILWSYRFGLRCVCGAHEKRRNQQIEEAAPCEIHCFLSADVAFTFLCVRANMSFAGRQPNRRRGSEGDCCCSAVVCASATTVANCWGKQQPSR